VRIFQHRIDLDNVRVVVAELFPGTVATNDQVLRHEWFLATSWLAPSLRGEFTPGRLIEVGRLARLHSWPAIRASGGGYRRRRRFPPGPRSPPHGQGLRRKIPNR